MLGDVHFKLYHSIALYVLPQKKPMIKIKSRFSQLDIHGCRQSELLQKQTLL